MPIMHTNISGDFWNCDCKNYPNPIEFSFCPLCGKKRPEPLPAIGDKVWVKAQVKEVVEPIPGGVLTQPGFRLFDHAGLFVPADYGETWMRVDSGGEAPAGHIPLLKGARAGPLEQLPLIEQYPGLREILEANVAGLLGDDDGPTMRDRLAKNIIDLIFGG